MLPRRETRLRAESFCGLEADEESLEALLALCEEERIEALYDRDEIYRSPVFAEILTEASRRVLPGRIERSLALARLAQTVLRSSDSSDYGTELYIRASAYVANGWKLSGSLFGSADIFRDMRFLMRGLSRRPRLTLAILDQLEGELLGRLRDFPRAELLQRRAIAGFEEGGEIPLAARTLVSLGVLLDLAGRPERAMEAQRQALGLLGNDGSLLETCARYNLAVCSCNAGRHGEARDLLEALKEARRLETWPQIGPKVLWLEGRIARALGETESAISLLRRSFADFRRRGNAHFSSWVSLELGGLYLEQGRGEELEALIVEIRNIVEGQLVHRDAFVALLLSEDSPGLEEISRLLRKELGGYLDQGPG